MVLKWVCLPLFLTKSLSRLCTGVLKGVNFCLCCSLVPRVLLPGVLKWVSSLLFLLLTHILFIWRVLKGVSKSVTMSSCGASVDCFLSWVCSGSSEMTKLFSLLGALFICKGLERRSWNELIAYLYIPIESAAYSVESVKMASWNEHILHYFCHFQYEGLERSLICTLFVLLNRCCVQICIWAVYKELSHQHL